MKISEFSSSRAGRPQLEQKWIESLGKGLQVKELTPTLSSSSGTFTRDSFQDEGNGFIYCNVNNLTHIHFTLNCTLTGAASTTLSLTLPFASIATSLLRGVVFVGGFGIVPCYLSLSSGSNLLTFQREDALQFDIVLPHRMHGDFTYFSRVAT